MKNNFNDKELELAAKNIVEGIARQCYIEPDEKPADNTISIKLAKAKAGARRHINRTIRICAVAAVLMVGLVCALFMGAKDEPVVIEYTQNAYMFKNFDTDSEWNMPVEVTVQLKEIKQSRWISVDKNEYIILKGNITVKDLEGNIVFEYENIESDFDIDSMSGTIKEKRKTKVEDYTQIDSRLLEMAEIFLSNDLDSFIINHYEKPSKVHAKSMTYDIKDAILIVSGAQTRGEAVDQAKDFYYEKNTHLYEIHGAGKFEEEIIVE